MATSPLPPPIGADGTEAIGDGVPPRRRSLLSGLGVGLLATAASALFPRPAAARQVGDVNELVRGGLVVVANWDAKEGQADQIADILRRFLPQAGTVNLAAGRLARCG